MCKWLTVVVTIALCLMNLGDQATGFLVGDVRGAISVKVRLPR